MKRKLRPWVKVVLASVAIVLFVLVLNACDHTAEDAEKASHRCAEQGYNGIAAKYTKEGDLFFVCVNYTHK